MPSWTAGRPDPGMDGNAGSRFLPGVRPRNIAHRGLAPDGAENTLRAFADAIAAGATMLETDTHASSDGVAFAVHDPNLRRLGADGRRIEELSAQELRGIRVASEPLAPLEDVLGAFGDIPVNIDVKTAGAIEPAARAIARTASADRVCVTSFSGPTARRAARAVERLTGIMPVRSAAAGTVAAFALAVSLGAPQRSIDALLRPIAALQVPRRHRGYPVVTPRSLAAAHRAGCEVHVWTIDEPSAMAELLGMGVDGIVTNRPDLLAALLER